ncbi:hypothetical protein NSA24_02960 [Clostridioides mangenotii]|uniref:phage tail terminator family protein n=1 Tax=Metaclostridioides mangenotii TaxID=1540 RepID=UPI00214A5F3E|nr:hypothetical protein [Clostridioides mangenotii]MCR1953794.1 hypothetical protein [Clostridioides mangenotii]
MLNEMITGIRQKLDEISKGLDVYTENTQQNYTFPSFFIYAVSSELSYALDNRRDYKCTFEIMYRPDKNCESPNKEMNIVADMLYEGLEVVVIEGEKFRAEKMETNIDLDVALHFYVDYTATLTEEVTKDNPMEDLVIYGGSNKEEA